MILALTSMLGLTVIWMITMSIAYNLIISFALWTRKEKAPGVLYERLYIYNKIWTPFCIVTLLYRCNCADICNGTNCQHHIWHSASIFDNCIKVQNCTYLKIPVKCDQQVYNPWWKFWGKKGQGNIMTPDKLEPIEEVKG